MASKEIERGKGTRGRGAEGKQNVAVMAESTPLEDIETGKKEKHVRYFKARVLDSHQSEGINGVVRDCMEDGIEQITGSISRPAPIICLLCKSKKVQYE